MSSWDQVMALVEPGRERYMTRVGASAWTGRELTEEESGLLLRAIGAGLVALAPDGEHFVLHGFRAGRDHRPKTYQAFSHWLGNAYWSWQEMFIQIGFATELVLDLGWASKSVELEALGFDVVCSDRSGPVVMTEAKVKPAHLDEQLRVMRSGGVGGSATDRNRYADLVMHKPRIYGGVALGTRRFYAVSFSDEGDLSLAECGAPRPAESSRS